MRVRSGWSGEWVSTSATCSRLFSFGAIPALHIDDLLVEGIFVIEVTVNSSLRNSKII